MVAFMQAQLYTKQSIFTFRSIKESFISLVTFQTTLIWFAIAAFTIAEVITLFFRLLVDCLVSLPHKDYIGPLGLIQTSALTKDGHCLHRILW